MTTGVTGQNLQKHEEEERKAGGRESGTEKEKDKIDTVGEGGRETV